MSHPSKLPTFKQIGPYKIEGLISSGGMSLLYLASDPKTALPIIVKVLLPKYLSEKDVVDRFLNEAHIISLANHPNIVRLVDSGRWEGGLYIAMEFIKGSSLRKIFQHQPYTLKRAMDVLLQIAYALSHLHSHGIVHGDLKPENILINEQGQVKVIDFGIAQVLWDEKMEAPPRFLGTPIYMSPELGIDRHNLSFQSDIFALGIIAYELAVGKISHGRVIVSLAPKGLQKLIQRSLQPRPIDRYADMCDFIADLTAYIRSGDIEKDKQGSDQFLEVFEKLETIQNNLLPHETPSWDDVHVDFAYAQAMGITGLYVDFFAISPNKKLVFLAESSKKGPEGLINACMLKSMLQCLLDSVDATNIQLLASRILAQIKKNFLIDSISFACLQVDSTTKEYSYCHNGLGYLSRIDPNGQYPLGTTKIQDSDIEYGKGLYEDGDMLFFVGTLQPPAKKIRQISIIEEVAKNEPFLTPQCSSEGILRRIRLQSEAASEDPPLSVILLHLVNSYGKKLPPLK